ncbi:putative deoxyUTP pyrophosphatase [Vibrio phage VspSw_1]|uniref:dUTP diphosphatase n=1 Tax=Vibrio phage VspSw_1 TaxID=2484249 RepID=A0A411BKC2_9CAUD|nr:putative deoxyUTP pyrophosphatase [Vibrio phage VspSw_1]QAY02081.1 putative deoxyUTP pyrophosphatase [Vibrio phage VspSw_1]
MRPVFQVENEGCMPTLGSEMAGGIDLRVNAKNQWIDPGVEYHFSLGVRCAIPKGWVGLIFPRSGLGVKYKLRILNTVGVIDADYRGVIRLACTFEEGFWMEDFERMCQMVLVPCRTDFVIGSVNIEETERGEGGYGSSGRT